VNWKEKELGLSLEADIVKEKRWARGSYFMREEGMG